MAYFSTPIRRYNRIYIDGVFDPTKIVKAYTNSSTLTDFTKPPYSIVDGKLVYYNDKLYLIGGTNSTQAFRYYNPTEHRWESMSTNLPIDFTNGIVVANGSNLHIMQGTSHWVYNNSYWEQRANVPFTATGQPGVVFDGYVHVVGNGYLYRYESIYNRFVQVASLPSGMTTSYAMAATYQNAIHVIGNKQHYKYTTDFGWSLVYEFSNNDPTFTHGIAVIFSNRLHVIFQSSQYSDFSYHYVFMDEDGWEKLDDIGFINIYNGVGIVYTINNSILMMQKLVAKEFMTLYRIETITNYEAIESESEGD